MELFTDRSDDGRFYERPGGAFGDRQLQHHSGMDVEDPEAGGVSGEPRPGGLELRAGRPTARPQHEAGSGLLRTPGGLVHRRRLYGPIWQAARVRTPLQNPVLGSAERG